MNADERVESLVVKQVSKCGIKSEKAEATQQLRISIFLIEKWWQINITISKNTHLFRVF